LWSIFGQTLPASGQKSPPVARPPLTNILQSVDWQLMALMMTMQMMVAVAQAVPHLSQWPMASVAAAAAAAQHAIQQQQLMVVLCCWITRHLVLTAQLLLLLLLPAHTPRPWQVVLWPQQVLLSCRDL
jgi:hypothetical protein